jgi:LmbE family N-acetylglucosaminyl deacetylase
VLVLAPHPDDDVLAAAGLLRWVRRHGGEARVVYATTGENNPWAQRAFERRWRIGPLERRRWGARRRLEALESLRRLGVGPGSTAFLGLPDQRLTETLLASPEALVAPLAAEITAWKPTLLLAPSLRDRHPDHGVIAIATRAALARLPLRLGVLTLAYMIHGPLAPGGHRWTFRMEEGPRVAKREALLAHESQLVWHRRAFLGACSADECFVDEGAGAVADESFPGGGTLRSEPYGWRFGLHAGVRDRLDRLSVLVVARTQGAVRATRVPVVTGRTRAWTWEGRPELSGAIRLERLGADLEATFVGGPAAAQAEWFVKTELESERRYGFMDRWPWLRVAQAEVVPTNGATPQTFNGYTNGRTAVPMLAPDPVVKVPLATRP